MSLIILAHPDISCHVLPHAIKGWLAQDVVSAHDQDLGAGEAISVELMSEAQLVEAVRSGELKHALALSVLARVFQLWPLPFVHDAL